MEIVLETVRVTREVTQGGPCALGHVTHSPGKCRTEALRPFHKALSSGKGVTWGAGSQATAPSAFRWPPHLRPTPRGPAPALGKQLRESSGNTNPPPSPSCSLRPERPCFPKHPGGAQPQKRASPAWLALARPSGYDLPSQTAGPVTPSGPTEPAPPLEAWAPELVSCPPSLPSQPLDSGPRNSRPGSAKGELLTVPFCEPHLPHL